jgi:hypothetical protein
MTDAQRQLKRKEAAEYRRLAELCQVVTVRIALNVLAERCEQEATAT